jgi:hypothetical protein
MYIDCQRQNSFCTEPLSPGFTAGGRNRKGVRLATFSLGIICDLHMEPILNSHLELEY